jgi:hypothetical protein
VTTSATTTDARVQYLLDRLEIQDVVARYAIGQDAHQSDGDNDVLDQWDDVFTSDATVDYSVSGGPEPDVSYRALAEHMRGPGLRGGGTMSVLASWQHLQGHSTVEIAGDHATARTPHLHTHKGRYEGDDGWNVVEAGVFHDELRRTPQGWRIARRRLEIHWLDTFVTGPGPFTA